ncbi:hypothetical protein EVAR_87646_1 [Eumeta japonica]|uniref:Uncharacterized protein n=1 Tax=Eumeta variegata TaxID=151549 RepID=A0A4C1WL92_EUMVA|nr:hypothetical protein EVAR_87646_1 [Eumeta japonica]
MFPLGPRKGASSAVGGRGPGVGERFDREIWAVGLDNEPSGAHAHTYTTPCLCWWRPQQAAQSPRPDVQFLPKRLGSYTRRRRTLHSLLMTFCSLNFPLTSSLLLRIEATALKVNLKLVDNSMSYFFGTGSFSEVLPAPPARGVRVATSVGRSDH